MEYPIITHPVLHTLGRHKSKMFLFSLCIAAISTHAFAANEAEKTSKSSEEAVTEMKAQKRSILKTKENGKGLTIGGYGEAV